MNIPLVTHQALVLKPFQPKMKLQPVRPPQADQFAFGNKKSVPLAPLKPQLRSGIKVEFSIETLNFSTLAKSKLVKRWLNKEGLSHAEFVTHLKNNPQDTLAAMSAYLTNAITITLSKPERRFLEPLVEPRSYQENRLQAPPIESLPVWMQAMSIEIRKPKPIYTQCPKFLVRVAALDATNPQQLTLMTTHPIFPHIFRGNPYQDRDIKPSYADGLRFIELRMNEVLPSALEKLGITESIVEPRTYNDFAPVVIGEMESFIKQADGLLGTQNEAVQ